MIKKIDKNITKYIYILSLLAGIVSIFQSWIYLHSLESNLDEGAYLFKGYMFAIGKYTPYQLNGFWTNHMPLAFLIPGYVQKIFGPSLAVGRYFMLVIFGCSLLGLWIITSRISSIWGACLALLVVALNPVLIKMYSTAVSQGLTACVLTWVLVFGVGENRHLWQLLLASILTACLVLIRINLLPVPLFLTLYILWQHGWRKGVATLLFIALPIIGFHIFYWPNILQIYVRWIPKGIFSFLDVWRIQHTAVGFWHPDISFGNRLISLFRTLRFHFVLLLGSAVSLTIFQKNFFCEYGNKFRELLFMAILFWSLLFAHSWVTLAGDYCNYCLEGYVSFFAPLGIIFTVSALPFWFKKYPRWIEVGLILFVIFVNAGIGLALIDDFHHGILYISMPRFLLKFPHFESGWFLPIEVLHNVFPSLTERFAHIVDIVFTNTIVGLIIVLIVFYIWRVLPGKFYNKIYRSFGYFLLVSLLVIGIIFSPTPFFSGGKYTYDCKPNTLSSYEEAGKALAQIIPSGVHVYWKSMAATPLLYIPGVQIYPPQINDIYSFYLKGDKNELLKLGLWNESLAKEWWMKPIIL